MQRFPSKVFVNRGNLFERVALTRSFAFRLAGISDDMLVIDQPIFTLAIPPLTRPIGGHDGLHGCTRIPQSQSELGRASTSLISLDIPAE